MIIHPFKLFALAKYVTGVDSFASFDNTELGDVSFSSTGSVLHNHGMKGYNLHVGSIVPIAGGDLTLGAYYADGKLTDTARVCNFLWAARSRLIDVGGDSVTQ